MAELWRVWRAPILAWVALGILLTATGIIAFIPLGSANLPISLFIAALKALLVGLVFMRLSRHEALNRLAAATGPIWIFVMFVLIFGDYLTR